jgi:hypothetical protein
MVKRLLLVSILSVDLMTLWSIGVNAYPPRLSGWSWSPGSITSTTTWLGISNTEMKPTDVRVTVNMDEVVVYYMNPGGNTGGVEVPFIYPVSIEDFDTITDPLRGKGKWTSTITFSDGDLLGAFPPGVLADYAPNPNWTAYDIDVLTFSGIVEGFTDVDGLEEEVVHAEYQCSLQGNEYACTESVHWEYSKKYPDPPHSISLIR